MHTRPLVLDSGFFIEIETCLACRRVVGILACIEDPAVMQGIVTHLYAEGVSPKPLGGHGAERGHSKGYSTTCGDPTMTSFGVYPQRRGP
jgi:hypothetical protein